MKFKSTKFIMLVLVLLVSVPTFAANRFWVGSNGASWTSTSSWSTSSNGTNGATVPGIADVAIFDGEPSYTSVTVDVSSATIAALTLQINAGVTLTFSGTATSILFTGATNSLVLLGYFNDGGNTITIGGNIAYTLSAGTMSSTSFSTTTATVTLPAVTGLKVGQFVTGTGIPTTSATQVSYISAINTSTKVVTLTSTGTNFTALSGSLTVGCLTGSTTATFASASSSIVVASATGIVQGTTLAATGLTSASSVSAVVNGTPSGTTIPVFPNTTALGSSARVIYYNGATYSGAGKIIMTGGTLSPLATKTINGSNLYMPSLKNIEIGDGATSSFINMSGGSFRVTGYFKVNSNSLFNGTAQAIAMYDPFNPSTVPTLNLAANSYLTTYNKTNGLASNNATTFSVNAMFMFPGTSSLATQVICDPTSTHCDSIVAGQTTQNTIISGPITYGNKIISNMNTTYTGLVSFQSGVTSTIAGTLTIKGSGSCPKAATLSGATGLILAPTSRLVLTTASDSLNLNSKSLILQSDATGTASITAIPSTTSLTNASNVTVQRYIPFQRGYRTFGHPFTTGQTLAGLNSAFAITGSGTGFNSSSSSSIFRYDSSAASGSALVGISNSPNSTSSVVWGAGQGLYALVRGSGTQGINFNYTGGKTAATASYTGTINQGALADYALGTANYTLVGNPYPSAINIKNVNSNGGTALSGNTNVYSTIYVYNPYKNAGADDIIRGGFDAYTNNGTNDIIIPSGGAFYVKAKTSGQVLKFTETSKSAGTAITLFGESNGTPSLKLGIESNKGTWDNVVVNLYNNGTSNATDIYDGEKFSNVLFDLYSLSSDGKKLCIDSRSNNLSSEQIIPLGIRTNEVGTDFKFTLQQNSLPSNAKVVLRDKLLQQEVVLDKDFTGYTFAMSSDTATKGNNRFELVVNGTAASVVGNQQDQAAFVSFNASPNPFRDVVTVSLDKTVTTSIRVSILNILGQSLQSKVVVAGTNNVQFSLSGESAGTYFVRVSTDKGEYTHKIVKQ